MKKRCITCDGLAIECLPSTYDSLATTVFMVNTPTPVGARCTRNCQLTGDLCESNSCVFWHRRDDNEDG